jgi:hypothetical protein
MPNYTKAEWAQKLREMDRRPRQPQPPPILGTFGTPMTKAEAANVRRGSTSPLGGLAVKDGPLGHSRAQPIRQAAAEEIKSIERSRPR